MVGYGAHNNLFSLNKERFKGGIHRPNCP